MAKRKSISKKIRFEIFKRDGFRCQYCGKTAHDVVLHVDHMKPVAEGGTNDLLNLITSCADCNLGKGAILLNDKTLLKKQHEQLEKLNEHREQLEMMIKWQKELSSLEDKKLNYLKSRIEELTRYNVNSVGIQYLRKLIKKYSLDLISEAIEDAAAQYLVHNGDIFTGESVEKLFDYIPKICNMKQLDKEKPYMKDLFYVRGILRNRLRYCDDSKTLQMLESVYLAGASIDSIKAFAKQVKNWSSFRQGIEDFLQSNDSEG